MSQPDQQTGVPFLKILSLYIRIQQKQWTLMIYLQFFKLFKFYVTFMYNNVTQLRL
jgi:hypothetical protein